MCTLSDVEAAENVILSYLLLSYFLRVCDLLSKVRGRKIRGLSVYLMVFLLVRSWGGWADKLVRRSC